MRISRCDHASWSRGHEEGGGARAEPGSGTEGRRPTRREGLWVVRSGQRFVWLVGSPGEPHCPPCRPGDGPGDGGVGGLWSGGDGGQRAGRRAAGDRRSPVHRPARHAAGGGLAGPQRCIHSRDGHPRQPVLGTDRDSRIWCPSSGSRATGGGRHPGVLREREVRGGQRPVRQRPRRGRPSLRTRVALAAVRELLGGSSCGWAWSAAAC